MRSGDEVLLPLVWQQLPGAEETDCFPLIRKIDIVSSNSFLIRTVDALILIDTGGLPEQAAQLAQLIREARKERSLPLVIFLTHAHIDHFLALQYSGVFREPGCSVIAIHEKGAVALETRDRQVTQAALLGIELPEIHTNIRLFPENSGPGTNPALLYSHSPVITNSYRFSNGTSLESSCSAIETGAGQPLLRERVEIGSATEIDVFHTPGHSPDSCCFKIGRSLFIGDLIFAANPGVAGLRGWDQEKLIRSIDAIAPFLSDGSIEIVCPGHGRATTAGAAKLIFASVRKDAQNLTGIEELSPERSRKTALYAEECLEHVSELFTIMAGRLYYVSFVIEELGETYIIEHIGSLIKSDSVDELIDSFSAFSDEMRSGKQQPIQLALKAAQVIAKIERSFDAAALARIIDPSLISRAGRLLSDYTRTLKGLSPVLERTSYEIAPVLKSLIVGHTVHAISDDDVMLSAEDDDMFVQALLSRIGTPPLLSDVEVSFECHDEALSALMDHDRFTDFITTLLEDLVGTGSRKIGISVSSEGGKVTVTLAGSPGVPSIDRRAGSFLRRLCEDAGGTLSCEGLGIARRYIITLSQEL